MATRHTTLQTLPPDGLVLEELIGALQSEYGVPTTPQEYRLIIKTRQPDEPATDPSIEVKADPRPPDSAPVAEVANNGDPAGGTGRPPGIRRRRRRRTGGASAPGEAAPDTETGDSSAAG